MAIHNLGYTTTFTSDNVWNNDSATVTTGDTFTYQYTYTDAYPQVEKPINWLDNDIEQVCLQGRV